MKTVLKLFAGLFAASILLVGIVYFIYPGLIISAIQSLSASGAGLSNKSVDINGYTAHFYEGGDASKPTLMLLHGLNDDKNSFVTSIRELSVDYHIILPDLQAHGENQKLDGRDYSIGGQAAFINSLSDSLGISQLVIGGHSMGGHTSAAFAANYPNKTRGLVLVNAKGMQLENQSAYTYFPEKVDLAFLKASFDSDFVTPPAFPEPVLQYLVNQMNDSIAFINGIIKQVENGADLSINEKVQSISAPSLVLWGKQDPIVPLTHANSYTDNLANARMVLFDDAGHSPQFEIPEKIQAELKAFMQNLN
ncbi:MAG: pimeloyl-ACP methyl ester carboxylesterase [Arenicella sp.]|jgi:pimeloyl-ACP methyl ester carboxylesterase